MIADLDTLLTGLYVELTDRIIPSRGLERRGPGKPPEVTDAELVCLAVAQVLLRYDDERHWLRAAARQVGRLFPRLLGQSEYNDRVKAAAPLMEAALRWLAEATPGSAEDVTIPTPAGGMPGYLSRPGGEGRWPGVVALHDGFGIDEAVRAQADWLAGAGYLAWRYGSQGLAIGMFRAPQLSAARTAGLLSCGNVGQFS